MDTESLIVAEFKRRLNVAFPKVFVHEGFSSPCNAKKKTMYLFAEKVNSKWLSESAKHSRTLEISLEFFFPVEKKTLYQEGRLLKERIRRAVELDERFAKGPHEAHDNTEDDDLVASYQETQSEIFEIVDNVCDVAISYVFTYYDVFNGYQHNRH